MAHVAGWGPYEYNLHALGHAFLGWICAVQILVGDSLYVGRRGAWADFSALGFPLPLSFYLVVPLLLDGWVSRLTVTALLVLDGRADGALQPYVQREQMTRAGFKPPLAGLRARGERRFFVRCAS